MYVAARNLGRAIITVSQANRSANLDFSWFALAIKEPYESTHGHGHGGRPRDRTESGARADIGLSKGPAGDAMFKGVITGIGLTLVVACLVAYAALRSGLIPANADATPGAIEVWAARTSLEATLNRSAPTGPNPVLLSDENLLTGVRLFAKNCAMCHGSADGAKSPIAEGQYPRPPQLAKDGVEDDPEGESFWKIKHGIRLSGMPSFGAALSDEQVWKLALFLKHMDKLPPAVQQAWLQVRTWPTDPIK
jgi:thiosulfate dehydrogenase